MLLNKLLFLIAVNFASALIVDSKEVDYCSVSSCKPRKHIMCEFPEPGGDSECGYGHKPYPLTDTQKFDLLAWHNTVRSGVALATSKFVPPGGGFDRRPVSNMLEMTWSKELERFAQRWADQCNVALQREHDQCRNRMHRNSEAGQIVFRHPYSTTSDTISEVLEKLKTEWTKSPLAMPKGKEKLTGPREWILQVTWPSAKTLGCAMSHFTNGTHRILMVVCNYGATVGPSGGPRHGQSCTDCPPPSQCSAVMPGLCEGAAAVPSPALVPLITGLALAWCGVDFMG